MLLILEIHCADPDGDDPDPGGDFPNFDENPGYSLNILVYITLSLLLWVSRQFFFSGPTTKALTPPLP